MYFSSKLNIKLSIFFKKNKSISRVHLDSIFKELVNSIMVKGRVTTSRNSIILFFKKFRKDFLQFDNSINYLIFFKCLHFNQLFENIFKTDIFFKFSFHRIDKKIRKFSRGKSGKYKIKFNYIPPFKRFRYILKSIKNEIKFSKGVFYEERFLNFFKTMTYNPQSSFIFRNKRFTYNYINRNMNNTVLLKSY